MNRLRVALAATACLIAITGLAQESDRGSDDESAVGVIEEVVVTGSRIKRQDFESISPIVTLDAEQFTFSGVTAVEDLLNDAPQLVPYFDRTGNNPGAGAAGLNLRGLGANRTLVTMNGRRLAPADEFGAVDINTIPSQLIERVEIVTGGASTVYGSDAVAGVVNFIIEDDFEGVELTAQYDTYGEGDGDVLDVSIAFGFGNERGHFTGFLNYQDRDAVFAGDRAFSTVPLAESFDPRTLGQLVPDGSTTTPAGRIAFPQVPLPGTGGQPVQVTFDADGSPRPFRPEVDQYNYQPSNYLQTPLERTTAAAFGGYDFSDRVSGFAEMLYSETRSGAQLAPPPGFVFLSVNTDNPLLTDAQRELFSSSFDPDADGIANFVLGRRLEETGPRVLERDADTLRLVLGLEGTWLADWDWEASYSLSDVSGEYVVDNAVFGDRFAQALLVDPATGACFDPSNGCVPFNPFGLTISPEAAEFLRVGEIIENYSVDEEIVTLATTGEWGQLPAGPIGLAFGLEWRELASRYQPDTNFVGGNVLGYFASSPVDGKTDVKEVFAEALVPLLAGAPFAEYVGIEAGYRYSDYRFSGGADNWKLGLSWSPTSALRFRVMAQRAIRAPNIDELFRQPAENIATLFPGTDRCSASSDPVGNGLTDLCITQGIPADQVGVYEATLNFPLTVFGGGGNTSLDPEEADTITVGLVYQPEWAQEFTLSLDYYDIEIDNAIGATALENALDLCFDANDPASPFCQPVVRGPTGDIVEYTNPQFNLANRKAEGIDIAAYYRWELGERLALFGGGASLRLQLLYNYAIENALKSTPGSKSLDCAGYYGGACTYSFVLATVVPKNRATTRLTYTSGPLDVALNWRWIGELENHLDITCQDFPQACYPSELGDISARNYFELSARYHFGERAELYGGVSNLFEEDPPLMGFGQTQSNTAPQLYDVFGRRFFLGFRYRL